MYITKKVKNFKKLKNIKKKRLNDTYHMCSEYFQNSLILLWIH